MRKNLLITLLSFLFYFQLNAQQTYSLDSTILTSRTVISGIDIPWEIIWGPDNQIWMTERYGRVSRLDPVNGTQNVILDLSSQIYQQNESGLLGMLLHPDFNNQSYVYLVYTYQSAGATKERLVKYFYNGSILVNPQILIDNITANSTHDGSRLMLLPDSTFLMTTGDAQATSLPQNTNSLNGKILRFNLDGTIPSDNPNPNSYVYSWGHRNAQGLCMGPNNIIYCSEHGPTTDDELQIVQKAGNYGWPSVAGFCSTSSEISFCNDSSVIEPLVAWTPTIAPSDMVWYNHPSIPEFENKLLMTVLKNKRLISFGFNPAGDSVIQESHYLVNQLRRLRDICVSPDGKIYLATNGDSWSNTNPFTHSIVELRNAAFVPSAVSVQSKPQIKIWPNPLTKGQQLNIVVDNNQNGTLRIFDLLGRSVYTKEFNNSFNFTLDLEQNLYLYHLELNDGTTHSGKLKIN